MPGTYLPTTRRDWSLDHITPNIDYSATKTAKTQALSHGEVATSVPILGDLDAANLQSQGLLRPGHNSGTRRLHKRRLNRFNEAEHRNIPLDIPEDSHNAENAFVVIPTMLVSHDTLVYLGHTADKADEIWGRWAYRAAIGSAREMGIDDNVVYVNFLDFVMAQLQKCEDVYEDDDAEWYKCLNECGMDESVQKAIMDPDFKEFRLDGTCVYWVKYTLAMRYRGLEETRRTSRQCEIELESALVGGK